MGARAPKQAVETLLEFLALSHGAERAAVFVAEGDRLAYFVGRSMEQVDLDWANRTWRHAYALLARGFETRVLTRSMIPIMRQKKIEGVLYLDAPAIHMETFLDVSQQLADAIFHSRGVLAQSAVDAYLESTPEEEIQRQKIVLLLAKNEHNLSRVARILKITRQALYRRMEVLGIERERTLKGSR